MSFIDVIVGTALMLIIFTALVGLLRTSLQIATITKTRSVATSVAESQMEYVRSLAYDDVGTVGGIPAGGIPQTSTTTLNGLPFVVRTLVVYVDDPADGTGPSDSNGITIDYKRVKVDVSYTVGGTARTVDIISNYAPPGLETTNGGGTLKVAVVNSTGAPVPGATVRVVNSSTTPSVDLTTFSDSSGIVFLPGAATSTQYQVYVSKAGYSSAQTYVRNATNQNPTPGYLTVVQNQTTTGTFAIDLLATLTVRTFLPIATSTFSDTFTSGSYLASMSNTAVSGGSVSLSNPGSGYSPSGSASSIAIAPPYLAGWGTALVTTSVPGGTTFRFHIVDGSGIPLPDTVLPGNSTGFLSSINLYGISTTTYPSIGLSADFATISTTTTPTLQDWSISYARGPIPLPSAAFSLAGTKTIGSTGPGAAIYKTSIATSTDSSGTRPLSLEWDSYTLAVSGYDVIQACNPPPYALSPGVVTDTSLIFASSTPNMVLVSVRDTSGAAVPNAAITVSRSGFSSTVTTDGCGSAYFGSLTSSTYSIGASKTGYTTVNASGISISGHIFYPVTME